MDDPAQPKAAESDVNHCSGDVEAPYLGGLSGVHVAGAIRLAKQLGPGHTIVTILRNYDTRYQSKLFNPEFLRSKTCRSRRGWSARPRCPTSSSDAECVPAEETAPRPNASETVMSTSESTLRVDTPQSPFGRSRAKEYLAEHIPGAVHFDIDTIAEHSTSLPHMLPDAHSFALAMGALGIVVYDFIRLFSAPRVCGLSGPSARAGVKPPPSFTSRLEHSLVANIEGVDLGLKTGSAQALDAGQDAASAARRRNPAKACPPAPHVGQLQPAALPPPAGSQIVPPDEFPYAIEVSRLDLGWWVVASCVPGVSATILWVVPKMIAKVPLTLYDGLRGEWGPSGKSSVVSPSARPSLTYALRRASWASHERA
ncbi:hypothetical protein [Xanthobacter flavus]|uniref:hypothetical protein n=1 Tax=Xanthobacter flavus TaxID=281 RepID=UPI00372AE859